MWAFSFSKVEGDAIFPTKNHVKITFSSFKKFKIQIKIQELHKI